MHDKRHLRAVHQPSLDILDHQMSVHASELSHEYLGISECFGSLWSQQEQRAGRNLFWEVGIPHSLLNWKIMCLNFKSSGVVCSEAHPWILIADDVYLLILLLEKHIILSCLENES